MDGLLFSLRREEMKMRKSGGTGKASDAVYKSSWFAYESPRFIMDKTKSRQTLNTIHNEGESPEVGKTDQSQVKEGNPSENVNDSLPLQPTKRKKKTEDIRINKAFEMLTACSNKALDDDSQHFGNVIATELTTYNDTFRCAIQTEILRIFVNANSGFYDRYQHTHTQTFINVPEAHFLVGQSISPTHNSPPSLCSQNPSTSCSGNTSPSPLSPLPHTFSAESVSPHTASS